MNRFKSDSISAPSPDEDVEFLSQQEMDIEEHEALLPDGDQELASSPGRTKKVSKKKYFDIDRPVSPGSGGKVGSLRPFWELFSFCKLCKLCKKKKLWCKRLILLLCFLVVSFLLLYQEDIRLYFGYRVYSPYSVGNTTVTVHSSCEFKNIRQPSTLQSPLIDYVPESPIPCFDDPISPSDGFPLSRSWDILPANSCINISHLNSNVCIEATKSSSSDPPHSITCLPSFMIIGFEKASTTELLLWLSYHPNLLGKWAETRFFSKVNSPVSTKYPPSAVHHYQYYCHYYCHYCHYYYLLSYVP